ncbi:hypothetical protein [Paenibacillus hamazuiensis]|uniref:hypothetical protein n=1 Tax=Paenibacillus hamazuiensis TaxID=2936508 RepID=UPI00200ED334|nr:hypothetical protein [Paenibacillus hamazuiensis]
MRKSKWLKWQIGAAFTALIAVLFHQVKDSPDFNKAYAEASSSGGAVSGSAQTDDPVGKQFRSGPRDGMSRTKRQSSSGYDGNSSSDSGQWGGTTQQPQASQTPTQRTHTRTGRS